MKKLICLLILTMGIISCSSDDEPGFDNLQLVGEWNWTSTCGGFMAGCGYPSEANVETLEFSDNIYIQKYNGEIATESSYTIIDTGTELFSELKLGNGASIRFRLIDDKLSIEGGDFWKEYERVK